MYEELKKEWNKEVDECDVWDGDEKYIRRKGLELMDKAYQLGKTDSLLQERKRVLEEARRKIRTMSFDMDVFHKKNVAAVVVTNLHSQVLEELKSIK